MARLRNLVSDLAVQFLDTLLEQEDPLDRVRGLVLGIGSWIVQHLYSEALPTPASRCMYRLLAWAMHSSLRFLQEYLPDELKLSCSYAMDMFVDMPLQEDLLQIPWPWVSEEGGEKILDVVKDNVQRVRYRSDNLGQAIRKLEYDKATKLLYEKPSYESVRRSAISKERRPEVNRGILICPCEIQRFARMFCSSFHFHF